MHTPVNSDRLDLLEQDLAANHLKGFWLVEENVLPYPRTAVQPHLWRWADVLPGLERAGRLVGLERADRRVLLLQNPGLPTWPWTTPTIHLSMQYLNPGEHAVAHRHTFAAFRFILHGRGAYTTIDGQQCLMEEGGLILTPQPAPPAALRHHRHQPDRAALPAGAGRPAGPRGRWRWPLTRWSTVRSSPGLPCFPNNGARRSYPSAAYMPRWGV